MLTANRPVVVQVFPRLRRELHTAVVHHPAAAASAAAAATTAAAAARPFSSSKVQTDGATAAGHRVAGGEGGVKPLLRTGALGGEQGVRGKPCASRQRMSGAMNREQVLRLPREGTASSEQPVYASVSLRFLIGPTQFVPHQQLRERARQPAGMDIGVRAPAVILITTDASTQTHVPCNTPSTAP